MTPSQMIPALVAEQRKLTRRVEKLEKMMLRRPPFQSPKATKKTAPKRKQDIRVLIKEMQKKYAGTTSLTDSLLAERRAEIAREEAEIRTRFARHHRTSGTGKGTRTRHRATRGSTES